MLFGENVKKNSKKSRTPGLQKIQKKIKGKRHFKIPPRKEVKYDKSGIFNENDECEKYTEQEPSQV